MIKIEHIPDEVVSVARDWHNGPDSVLYRLAYRATQFKGVEVDPDALLDEIRDCLGQVADRKTKEASALVAAEIWCLDYLAVRSAEGAIRQVVRRASEAGIDPKVFATIATAEWESIAAARRADEANDESHSKGLRA